jgi:uncharacterized membrane protein
MNAFVWSLSGGFQDTGLIDGLNCGFNAISDNGTVAGWRGSHSAAANTRAIAGSVSSLQILPPVTGGTSSTAHSVNAAGDVCGYGRTPSPFGGFDNRAFVWRDGVMSTLEVLRGYRRSYANEITDGGVVGGQCTTLESNGAFAPSAFVWHSGVMRDVTAMLINESGEVVEMDSVNGIDEVGRLAGSGFANGEHGTAIVLSPADLPGDVTQDCQVDINDLLAVLNAWGTSDPDGDADGDGLVNINDLLMVLNNWMT